ncbi:WXG100 family type VII secretion target [Nocardia tengchongensis]|uniref:WXG100 family type VII secretion target n=1 Tax=Nocardia tengchongensis TaxID=2055889 RepID=UPI00368EB52A
MAIAPLPDTTTATDQLRYFRPAVTDDWAQISKPLAEQFYPAVMNELNNLTDEPALPVHLGYIVDTLRGSPAIDGTPATLTEYASRYASAATVVKTVVAALRHERRVLEPAWQGKSGTHVQKYMASVTFDARQMATMFDLGADTVTEFAANLDHAQQLDIHPRATLADAWTVIQALPKDAGLDDAGVLKARAAAESGCAGLTLARVATVKALLVAHKALWSRQPPVKRDLGSIDNADAELANTVASLRSPDNGSGNLWGDLVFDQDQVDRSNRALKDALVALYRLNSEWTEKYVILDGTGLGELLSDAAEFQFAGVDGLAWVTKRVRHLTYAIDSVGVDLVDTDAAASQLVTNSQTGDLTRLAAPPIDSGQPTPRVYQPGVSEPTQSATTSPTSTAPRGPSTEALPVTVPPPLPAARPVQSQISPVSARTGLRRDPDDFMVNDPAAVSNVPVADVAPTEPGHGVSIEFSTLRGLATEHVAVAESSTGLATEHVAVAESSTSLATPHTTWARNG